MASTQSMSDIVLATLAELNSSLADLQAGVSRIDTLTRGAGGTAPPPPTAAAPAERTAEGHAPVDAAQDAASAPAKEAVAPPVAPPAAPALPADALLALQEVLLAPQLAGAPSLAAAASNAALASLLPPDTVQAMAQLAAQPPPPSHVAATGTASADTAAAPPAVDLDGAVVAPPRPTPAPLLALPHGAELPTTLPEGWDVGSQAGELVPFLISWRPAEEFFSDMERGAELQDHKAQMLALKEEAQGVDPAAAGAVWAARPADPTDLLQGLSQAPPSTQAVGAAGASPAAQAQAAAEAGWRAAWLTADEPDAAFNEDGEPAKFAAMALRCVYETSKTGFADAKDFDAQPGAVIAGRYRVLEHVGSAAFSSALSCEDMVSGEQVCLKVVKNNKDYLDQSLDEVKLLRYLNLAGDADAARVLRLKEYFYYKEHLFIVTELLKDNLYDLQEALEAAAAPTYYTLPRVQRIAKQVLQALAFVHAHGIVHCDLKPENILVSSFSRCEVKVIDFGSSCFITDSLTSYIQSRSYRAPEVILGLPYDFKIDVWSLGAILPELLTGQVLFVNDHVQNMLARILSLYGPFPDHMTLKGSEVRKYLTFDGQVFQLTEDGTGVDVLQGAPVALDDMLGPEAAADAGFVDFLNLLLQPDPARRPTAAEALKHPWLAQDLPVEPYDMSLLS